MLTHTNRHGSPLLEPCKIACTHVLYPSARFPKMALPLADWGCKGAKFLWPTTKIIVGNLLNWSTRLFTEMKNCLLTETTLLKKIKNFKGRNHTQATVLFGTPGPYNKLTVILNDVHGQPIEIAKVAYNLSTQLLLSNEGKWLEKLNYYSVFRDCVPSSSGTIKFENVSILYQSVIKGKFSNGILDSRHIEFLSKLHNANDFRSGYHGSLMYQQIENRLENVSGLLSPQWKKRIMNARFAIFSVLNKVPILMVAAHRDFAPWNMRVNYTSVVVFDWEFASEGYVPLYDLFHYLLLPLALKRNITFFDITQVLEKIGKLTISWPSKKKYCITGQLLAYLLDWCLYYLEAFKGDYGKNQVLNRYANLIDTYLKWSKIFSYQ